MYRTTTFMLFLKYLAKSEPDAQEANRCVANGAWQSAGQVEAHDISHHIRS
jgi:hypothetical protein